MAFKDGSGPDGHLYTTYSDIAGRRFGIILGAAFIPTTSYSLTPELSGLGKDVSQFHIQLIHRPCEHSKMV